MNEVKIIDHWINPRHKDGLMRVAETGTAKNEDCGDVISIDIWPVGGRIDSVTFTGNGCVLCLAGASMLAECLIGKPLEAAKQMTEQDMLALYEGVPTPVRMACCLLPLEALRLCPILLSGGDAS